MMTSYSTESCDEKTLGVIMAELNPLSASVATNQLTGFYMRVTLTLNGLNLNQISISKK